MTRLLAWVLLVVSALLALPVALGHGLSVPVLVVEEVDAGDYAVRWQQAPGFADAGEAFRRLAITFPEHCELRPPRLRCGGTGLGGTVRADGLDAQQSVVVLRVAWLDGGGSVVTLTSASPDARIIGRGEGWQARLLASGSYFGIGVEHILLGVDHLLFVLGLTWIVSTRLGLLKTITAFTVAHSITLALATFEVLSVPMPPVDAVIALSIAFVAVEALRIRRGERVLTARHPWPVAFAFGLLHGLGFASALGDLGLPREDIPWALLLFNLGVEVGQIAFVLLVLLLAFYHRRAPLPVPAWSRALPVYLVGTAGMFWFIERMSAMWRPVL